MHTIEEKSIQDAYTSIKEDLRKNPGDLLKIRRAAYLSLFLGCLEEAYHWSVYLNFHGLPSAQKSRQKRIEKFLGIRKSEEQSQAIGGIVRAIAKEQRGKPRSDEEIVWGVGPRQENAIKDRMGWNAVSERAVRIFIYSSPSHVVNNIPPFAYEPGAEMNHSPEHREISKKIIGYWYYSGFVSLGGDIKEAVFRYPEYPRNEREMEVFFEGNPVDGFEVSGGESIVCYFSRRDEVRDAWLECKLRIYSIFLQRLQQFGRGQSFYQGHEDWGLPGQRPTMLRLATYNLERWLRPEHEILDIGCNIGCLGIEVSRRVKSYTGFDSNPDLIEIAKILADFRSAEKCEFLSCDFNNFIESNKKKYDFIFSFAVHSWIGLSMGEYAKILKSMLNPGGCILVESHDLKTSREKFMGDMKFFLEEGFVLLDKGDIKDDGVIGRSFFILKI